MTDDPLADLLADVTTDDISDDLLADMDVDDDLLADMDDPLADLTDDVTGDDPVDDFLDAIREPYTVVERTEPCGKDVCACTDDPDAEHGPYRYHVHTEPDGSRRWEYIGVAYDV